MREKKKYSNVFKFIIFGIWKIISEFQSMLFTTLKLKLMGTSEDALLKILFKRKCSEKKYLKIKSYSQIIKKPRLSPKASYL